MFDGCKTGFFFTLFMLIFLVLTLPIWLLALLTDLCLCCAGKAVTVRRCRGRFFGRMSWICWNIALFLCFWIRLDYKGVAGLPGAGTLGRPLYIGCNHQSFFDSPLCCCLGPWRLVGDVKTLMARGMMKLPILGRMAQAIGHMPVPFTSKTTGDFSVDRSKMAELQEAVDAHITSGGHLMVFPEGDLNRDWKVLKPFRVGGMEMCIRHDMEMWGFVMVAPSRSWHPDSAFGGQPTRITVRAFRAYESAKDAAERLAGPGADLRAQATALAEDYRKAMQRCLEDILASDTSPLIE